MLMAPYFENHGSKQCCLSVPSLCGGVALGKAKCTLAVHLQLKSTKCWQMEEAAFSQGLTALPFPRAMSICTKLSGVLPFPQCFLRKYARGKNCFKWRCLLFLVAGCRIYLVCPGVLVMEEQTIQASK